MADRRKRFTEQMIDRLRRPSRGRLEMKDALTAGLVLRVTRNTALPWVGGPRWC